MNSDEQVNARFPGWDYGMYRWAVKQFTRCRYQIPSYISLEDFLQQVYSRYYFAIKKRSKTTKAEKVFYFKKIVTNSIITQSRKVKCDPVVSRSETISQEEFLDFLITKRVGGEHPSIGLFSVLKGAPRELLQLITLFFTDDGKKLLSNCSTRIKSNGDRETNNELLCRLIGVDGEKVDLQKVAEDYLNG